MNLVILSICTGCTEFAGSSIIWVKVSDFCGLMFVYKLYKKVNGKFMK